MTPRTRRILTYSGASAVVVLAAGLGTFAALRLEPRRTAPEIAVPAEIASPPPAAAKPGSPAATAALPAGATQAAAPAKPAGPATTDNAGPSFDVVRVEPSGDNVVAGRAAPQSKVELLANGKVAETTMADESGQFVMTPPALTPGNHELTLRAVDPAGHAATSRRAVVVSVPSKSGDQLLVVAEEPGKPAQILSAGPPPAAARPAAAQTAALTHPETTAAPPSAAGRPHVDAVETDAGRLFVQGTGAPASRLGIYLNDTHVADAVVGADGRWTLTIKRGLTAGNYEVRVDQIGPDGKVVARAAVPFDYHPAAVVAATPAVIATPAPQAAATENKAAAPGGPNPGAASSSAPGVSSIPVPGPATAERGQLATPPVGASSAGAAKNSSPATAEATRADSVAASPQLGAPPASASVGPPASGVAAPSASAAVPPSTVAVQGAPPAARDAANPVIESIGTVSVVRGDSLWRISRTIYGHGIRYTVIYAANQDQIRDPDLIYPGQVFVVPPRESPGSGGSPSPG